MIKSQLNAPLHCPRCRRPVAFFVDRLGRVHSYCPEAERLAQASLGPCQPVVYAAAVEDEAISPQRPRRARPPRKTGTHPQRKPKVQHIPRGPTTHQRLEGLRRYYLRKHGVAA